MSEVIAKPQIKNSRLPMLLIFLIPSVAMGFAWLMFFTGLFIPEGRTNKGELILPSAQFSELQLIQGEAALQAGRA